MVKILIALGALIGINGIAAVPDEMQIQDLSSLNLTTAFTGPNALIANPTRRNCLTAFNSSSEGIVLSVTGTACDANSKDHYYIPAMSGLVKCMSIGKVICARGESATVNNGKLFITTD